MCIRTSLPWLRTRFALLQAFSKAEGDQSVEEMARKSGREARFILSSFHIASTILDLSSQSFLRPPHQSSSSTEEVTY